MAKNIPATIPQGSAEQLRQHVTRALNKVSTQIAQSDRRTAPMDLGNNRITSVANPANALDAVNLRTLKKYVGDITQPPNRRTNAQGYYTIVFSNNGFITAGQLSPPYIIMPNRSGSAFQVTVACVGIGAASAAFNISVAGINILATSLVLPSGQTGPVSSTAFITGVPPLSVGTIILPVIVTAGGVSYVSLQLEVQP